MPLNWSGLDILSPPPEVVHYPYANLGDDHDVRGDGVGPIYRSRERRDGAAACAAMMWTIAGAISDRADSITTQPVPAAAYSECALFFEPSPARRRVYSQYAVQLVRLAANKDEVRSLSTGRYTHGRRDDAAAALYYGDVKNDWAPYRAPDSDAETLIATAERAIKHMMHDQEILPVVEVDQDSADQVPLEETISIFLIDAWLTEVAANRERLQSFHKKALRSIMIVPSNPVDKQATNIAGRSKFVRDLKPRTPTRKQDFFAELAEAIRKPPRPAGPSFSPR